MNTSNSSVVQHGPTMGTQTFIEILLAIFLPPVGVFLRYGLGVMLSLLLTLSFAFLFGIDYDKCYNETLFLTIAFWILYILIVALIRDG